MAATAAEAAGTVRRAWYTLATAFRLQLRLSVATPNYLSSVFFQPALMAILAGLVFEVAGKAEAVEFAAVGAGMFGVWNSNLHASAGIIQGERRYHTLEFLVTTRSPLFLVILGKTVAAAAFSLLSLGVCVGVVAVGFGRPLQVASVWVLLLGVAVSMAAVTVVGLLLSSLAVTTRHYWRLFDFFYLVFILSGLLFPVELLPRPIQPLSYLLPTTWSAGLVRAGLGTAESGRWLVYAVGAVATTAAYLVAALGVYSVVIRVARVEARLARY
ncbi:MAG: ABC transporter permease [Bacillota bacterium]